MRARSRARFQRPGSKTLITAFVFLVLAALPCSADDFWVPDETGRISHTWSGDQTMQLCMQGRAVVMQVQCSPEDGLSYTARFFNVKEDFFKGVFYQIRPELDPGFRVGDEPLHLAAPESVAFDGMLTFTYPQTRGVVVTRTVYPSRTKPLVIEQWELRNTSQQPLRASARAARRAIEATHRGKAFETPLVVESIAPAVGPDTIAPGEVLRLSRVVQCKQLSAADVRVDIEAEHRDRRALAEAAFRGPGRLETPDPALDLAFALQKLHVLESPIDTYKGVITHNGSLRYSPGVWANDPVEYSSPLFPFFGDAGLNEAALNMYHLWLSHCQQHGIDPFPGSFEHADLQLVQKHRGDNAMMLYALPKFLMFLGDRDAAQELWPLIEFAARSVEAHKTADGIIASKTDEMEGRYPTGSANLSTSSLAYGGYRLAADLGRALGKTVAARTFDRRADELRKAIETSFGANVEGFETYRYYRENTTLRGWVLLPLAMGITQRQDATVEALTSDKLWPNRMQGGDILAESTRQTEWARETYYALRVLFMASQPDTALKITQAVVKAQVFGSEGPYPDEDAIDMLCPGSLYPRIFTEGAFGIRPIGLDAFECTPWLPTDWSQMALRDMRAFGHAWDMVVERVGEQLKVTVTDTSGRVVFSETGPAGITYTVSFREAELPATRP